MSQLQRVVKPKTQRGKRAIIHKEPKIIENVKRALFVRGVTASGLTLNCLKDIATLKKPNAVFFGKKNEIVPFEDITKMEFFAKKNDASLFMFASHNKKRPHNLVMGRMFSHHLLDMVELGIENFTALKEFKGKKIPLGIKPCLIFSGEEFEQQPIYQRLKNLLIDFFHVEDVSAISLDGIEHVLLFSAMDNKVFIRSYRIDKKTSGSKTPRIELEEIGPSLDLTLRRTNLANRELCKRAIRRPKEQKIKKVKNIRKDPFGSKLGRIHMERQDLKKLQLRKMKGLKKRKLNDQPESQGPQNEDKSKENE